MACILVVSSDQATIRALEQFMVFQGHLALTATNLREMMETLQQWQVDVLFLDLVGPQEEIEQMQRFIRGYPLLKDTHIIFLTWAESHVRELLRPELDDFLIKPIPLSEFEKRVNRLLGGAHHGSHRRLERTLCCGSLRLDGATFQVTVGGRPVGLTPTEFGILRHLMDRAGQVIAMDELLGAVWGYAPGLGGPELVRVHIKNLRRKLEGHAEGSFRFIQTVPGQGYLVPAEPGLAAIPGAA